MKILIVEDDRALGMFLGKGLKLEGHETDWVEDGEAALDYLETHQPDLMVLDLGLPVLDGIGVLERMGELAPQTAVLVLTGRNDVEERVRCLNLGADDFLQKPFSFHELTARCRAILRRQSSGPGTTLRSGSLSMDLVQRRVKHCGSSVELTPKEFALLECLMRANGSCCTRESLLRTVWQVRADACTNVVDVYINYLRKKLVTIGATSGEGANGIETVRGTGYRIVARSTSREQGDLALGSTLLARGA